MKNKSFTKYFDKGLKICLKYHVIYEHFKVKYFIASFSVRSCRSLCLARVRNFIGFIDLSYILFDSIVISCWH